MSGTWTAGWLPGDVLRVAEIRKGMGAIFDTTLGAAASTVDVTGIVATYAHLRVVAYLRGDTAAGATALSIRFNADSSAAYDGQYVLFETATTAANESFGAGSSRSRNRPAPGPRPELALGEPN